MADTTPQVLIDLYKEMYDLTLPECKKCRVPMSCCSGEYCEYTMEIAAERGVVQKPTGHARLPLMGPTGCTAPPHLRPLCSMHTCDMNSLGTKRGVNPAENELWDKRYFDLRAKIEEEEFNQMEKRDAERSKS